MEKGTNGISILRLVLLLLFLFEAVGLIPPTWITSNYIQADSYKVINGDACNCATGNDVTPTTNILFARPFTSIPNLAFGISSYLAQDSFFNEKFEVNRTDLRATYFRIAVQIRQLTRIWILEIRFIGITKQFPHHLNNFDNVPINYTFGPLVNISSPSNTETTFSNTINYTNQAIAEGETNNMFNLPLSNNKILLFLTSLFIEETTHQVGEVYLRIQTDVLTVNTYKIVARFAKKGIIQKLHFSMIIFDQQDIQKSGSYKLVYDYIDFVVTPGYYAFPSQFLTNFMVGFFSFESDTLRTTLNFKNTFESRGTNFGMSKSLSIPRGGYGPILHYKFTIFYLKTWYCPTGTFFDHLTEMCVDCPISQCLLCFNTTFCLKCNSNISYYFNGTDCTYCDPALGIFINSSTLNCQICEVSYCLNCSSLVTCQTCDSALGYFLNSTDNLCYSCQIFHCLNCSSLNVCSSCNTSAGYFVDQSLGTCHPCLLSGCIQCNSLSSCLVCDSANNYGLDYTSPNRSLCGFCNVSCTCSGYTTPWIPSSQSCTSLCGDGLIRLAEQCDDNNTQSGDGCSSSCQVESYFICDQSEPSTCNQTLFIQAQFLSILKHGCNEFKVSLKTVSLLQLTQITPLISFLDREILIKSIAVRDGVIDIVGEYLQDIGNKRIMLKISPGIILNFTYTPEIPALRYTQSQCNYSEYINKFMFVIQIISYFILLLSLFSCKIIGLQLFGVLQLSYFTLSMQDFFVIYLAPIANFRLFNGMNINFSSQSKHLPSNLARLDIKNLFYNNCNIMIILMVAQLLISCFIFIISNILKRQALKIVAMRLLKQGFITIVLFNIFNISFSAGVHWKYVSKLEDGYILDCFILYGVLIVVLAAIFALQLTQESDYGQFKKKFKNSWNCKVYIPLTILYRAFLGLYSSLYSDYSQGTIIIIGPALAFLLYFISNFPFSQTYQNYRAAFCHITMVYILLTSNYYQGMKMNTPLQIKGREYKAAIIQIILIGISLLISFLSLLYELFKTVKKWKNRRRKSEIFPTIKIQIQRSTDLFIIN